MTPWAAISSSTRPEIAYDNGNDASMPFFFGTLSESMSCRIRTDRAIFP